VKTFLGEALRFIATAVFITLLSTLIAIVIAIVITDLACIARGLYP
jgi:hypothetical protein